MAEPYVVAVLSFSDGRTRVHDSLVPAITKRRDGIVAAIEADPMLTPVVHKEIVHGAKMAREAALWARRQNAEAVVFNIPVFAFPNFSLIAARVLEMPVGLVSPKDGSLPGAGGVLAAAGAMMQIGLPLAKFWGAPEEEPAVAQELRRFCRATAAIQRLKGSVYALIGGRSIGMNTGAVSEETWMSQFGVDVEHIDQLEIVRRAGLVPDAEVNKGYHWLKEHLGHMAKVGKAAEEHVKTQIRHYIATKQILSDFGADLTGIKCHYDLSEYYVTQCLSAMLLNDPYDWEGPKEPIMMGCEADGDGALTMHILKLLTGYPSLLFDVRSYDSKEGLFVFCNCGSQPSWYAARSDNPKDNLSKVHLEPVIEKYAGNGGHFSYVCRECEFTLARLSRRDGFYRMVVTTGEFLEYPREKMKETAPVWPHGFAKLSVDPDELFQRYDTNHAHVVPDDHRREVELFCEYAGIDYEEL